jgi:hypothetical protein
VAVLRRILDGERRKSLLDGLDTIDVAIVRQTLTCLGAATTDSEAVVSWGADTVRSDRWSWFAVRYECLAAQPWNVCWARTLVTNPKISVHYGHFPESRVRMLLADPKPECSRTVEVLKTEEKGTDVNIATLLLLDAFNGDSDLSVLISNDADLALPLRVIADQFAVPIGIINPFPHPCRELLRLSPRFYKKLREGVLSSSQLPPSLRDATGTIHCPKQWETEKAATPPSRDVVARSERN